MLGNCCEDFARGVVEQLHLAAARRVARTLLLQHLDHHVVRGFVDEGDQHLLTVEQEIPGAVLRHGGFGDLPHKVPCQDVGEGVAQLFHVGLVDIAGFRGAHVGDGVIVAVDGAFRQKLMDNFRLGGGIEAHLAAPKAVFFIGEQVVQRNHRVFAGEIGRDVVGVGDADVGGGVRGDVGNDVVVDFAVVRIQPEIHGDVGIQRFKVRNGLLVDVHLSHVGVVFCPEGDLIPPGGVEFVGNRIGTGSGGILPGGKRTVAAGEGKGQRKGKQQGKQLFHPFTPPLETPSMIFFRKIRNRTISGREMATTAAIMAGMFSRPKPFSRIS